MAAAPTSPHRRSNGGLARAAALSAEDRTRISRDAARARHAKARHSPSCPIPRLGPSPRQVGGLEPPLMLPVEFIRRLGVHKDLLRWFMTDADFASAGVSEGDVILVATVDAVSCDGLHALARDGAIVLGRAIREDDAVLFEHRDGEGPDPIGDGVVVGRVVGRMGRFDAVA